MSKRLCIGFSILEISYWCFFASFISFLSAYFLSKGMTNTRLSCLLASYLLAAIVGSFVWGSLCDFFHTNKKILIICFILSAIIMYLLYFCGSDALLLIILYPLLGFVSQPISANIDAWLLSTCNHDSTVYGKIRAMPSFFYAFIAAILGRLITTSGYLYMLIFGSFFIGMGIVISILLPDIETTPIDNKMFFYNRKSLLDMFKIKEYLYLIFLLFMVGMAIAPMNNLKAVILSDVGGNASDLGIDSFIAAMTQVPFIAMAGKINKLSIKTRYLIITFLPFLCLLLIYIATSPMLIFCGSFLYNMGYGIMLPTMRQITENNVDKKLRNLGHSVADAVFTSFAGIISLIYSGAIIDKFGTKRMLVVCILFIIVPFLNSFFHAIIQKKEDGSCI